MPGRQRQNKGCPAKQRTLQTGRPNTRTASRFLENRDTIKVNQDKKGHRFSGQGKLETHIFSHQEKGFIPTSTCNRKGTSAAGGRLGAGHLSALGLMLSEEFFKC